MTRPVTRLDRIARELAVGRAAADDTARLVQLKSRPWYEAGGAALFDEPAVQLAAGRVAVDLAAAEAALTIAPHIAGGTDIARGLVGEAALRAASHLFEAAGTTAADDPEDFGRHWAWLRHSTVEDPVSAALIAAGRVFLAAPAGASPEDAQLVPYHENSRCIVIWGSNPPASHPFATEKILSARKAGAKLIVIDPRRTEMARRADVHLAPRPGSDGALAWGLINHLVRNNLHAADFLEEYAKGFAEADAYARRFTLERTEQETGVPRALIKRVAETLGESAPRSLNLVGNGLEHHVNGLENIRAIALIDAVTGSIDRPGGSRLPDHPALRDLGLYRDRDLTHLNPYGSRRYPLLYRLHKESHTMSGLNSVFTGRPYRLRGLLLTAANPVLSNPASAKVREALKGLELLVVRDLFMTETAECAQYVLPAASFLERTELHVFAPSNTIGLARKAFALPECQDEYAFWHALAHRLGIGADFPWEDEDAVNRWLLQDMNLTPEDIEAQPQGYRYAPLSHEKWKHTAFATPSGKIEFSSGQMADLGYRPLPEYRVPAYLRKGSAGFPLLMISGSRRLRFNGSRYRNLETLTRQESGPKAGLHPDDARRLSIQDGQRIRIISRGGSIVMEAAVLGTDDILPGYIDVPYGWSFANVNLLTPDDQNDLHSGFPSLKAVPVRIETTFAKPMIE